MLTVQAFTWSVHLFINEKALLKGKLCAFCAESIENSHKDVLSIEKNMKD